MRFIKRLIFIILLLVIAFFIYRLINPTAANSLLHDLKSFSNDKIGTNFSLTSKILVTSGTVSTGSFIETTGNLSELNDEELLLNDMELPTTGVSATGNISEIISSTTTSTIPPSKNTTPCPAMPTVNLCPADQEKYVSYSSTDCGTYYSCRPKTTTTPATTSPKGLSTQDIRDLKNLFGN